MPSFEMQYDEDEDVLEVTFAVFDEHFARTIPLNDHIFVFSDLGFGAVWGLTFYSYSRLLGVSETEFTGLRDLGEDQVSSILAMLSRAPASYFFDLTDPESLIARIASPDLEKLISLQNT
jgi:hypothetical protein